MICIRLSLIKTIMRGNQPRRHHLPALETLGPPKVQHLEATEPSTILTAHFRMVHHAFHSLRPNRRFTAAHVAAKNIFVLQMAYQTLQIVRMTTLTALLAEGSEQVTAHVFS